MIGHPIDDAQLIERLADLSGRLAWPATADLADRVMASLQSTPATGRPAPIAGRGPLGRLGELVGGSGRVALPGGRRVARRSLLIALVALLIVAVAAAALGIGVPGIRIEFGGPPGPTAGQTRGPAASGVRSADSPGASPSGAIATPVSGATPPGDELGPSVSLDQARRDAGFGLLLPTAPGIGTPTEVHLNGVPPFGRVTLIYQDRTTLTEFLGAVQPDAFQKVIGGGTTVDPVRVGGADGWWIEGAPHELMILYRDADGVGRWRQVTVTGHVLIWQAGTVTLRLDTPLDRTSAIALGASLR
jgi:hypothetical protein